VKWVAVVYFIVETLPLYRAFEGILGLAQLGNVAHAAHFGGMVLAFVWTRYGSLIASWWGRRRGHAKLERREKRQTSDQDEMDRILTKIHERGIGSLTTAEKMFLQRASRRHHEDEDQF
jgi:membrane protein DedA with SNARE-associated domain